MVLFPLSIDYGNSTAANYGQGPYSGYHQAAQQDYTYGRGASYGTQGASYGQQDYSYPRNFASEMPTTCKYCVNL